MRLLRFLVLVGTAAVVAGSAFAPASVSAAASEFTIVDLGVGNVVVNDANDAGHAAGRVFRRPPVGFARSRGRRLTG